MNDTVCSGRVPQQIRVLGITTADRVVPFHRCIASYIKHLDRWDRPTPCVVIERSSRAEISKQYREAITSLRKKTRRPIHYVGQAEVVRFRKCMKNEGVPEEILSHLFDNRIGIPSSPGRTRNTLLFATTGEPVLSVDDDSLCIAGDLRQGDQAIHAVSSAAAKFDTIFLKRRRDAFNAISTADVDLLAAHEVLLGRDLGEVFGSPKEELSGGVEKHRETRALSDILASRGHVLITLSGVAGDSGIPDLPGFLLSGGVLRERFLCAWDGKPQSSAGRNLVRGVHAPIVAASGVVITTTATGLDNRALLPPFLCSGRGEDRLFGDLTGMIYPASYLGYVPFALFHAPPGRRRYNRPQAGVRLVGIIGLLLKGALSKPSSTPEQRYAQVGDYLREWGVAAETDFAEAVTGLVRSRLEKWIMECRSQLSASDDSSSKWATALHDWVSVIESSMDDPDLCLPRDMPPDAGCRSTLQRTQTFLRFFGMLLAAWPELVCLARSLRARSLGLARDLE